jgi:hypothetical protein
VYWRCPALLRNQSGQLQDHPTCPEAGNKLKKLQKPNAYHRSLEVNERIIWVKYGEIREDMKG